MRRGLSVLLLSVLLANAACAGLRRTTTGQWVGDAALVARPSVVVLEVPNVGEEGTPGAATTTALRDGLISHQIRVRVFPGPFRDALREANERGFLYVLKGQLTEWEDNPTAWSGNPDKATLSLEIYEATSGDLLAAVSHRVVGPHVVWTANSPAEFIPEIADHALARIFGWRPKVWVGGATRR